MPDSGSGGSFLNLLVLVFIASAFYIATSDKPQPHHRSGSSSYSSSSDAVDDAYRICQAMDKTGLTTGCKVGVFKVDVTMDTNGAEARKICAGVADMMTGKTSNFSNGKWQLRILSPYSSDQAIAVCPLK